MKYLSLKSPIIENLGNSGQFISIVLQLTNKIKQKFPAKSCGARAVLYNSYGSEVVKKYTNKKLSEQTENKIVNPPH